MSEIPKVKENEHMVVTPIYLHGYGWDETYIDKNDNPIEVAKEIQKRNKEIPKWVYLPLWRFREELTD